MPVFWLARSQIIEVGGELYLSSNLYGIYKAQREKLGRWTNRCGYFGGGLYRSAVTCEAELRNHVLHMFYSR